MKLFHKEQGQLVKYFVIVLEQKIICLPPVRIKCKNYSIRIEIRDRLQTTKPHKSSNRISRPH